MKLKNALAKSATNGIPASMLSGTLCQDRVLEYSGIEDSCDSILSHNFVNSSFAALAEGRINGDMLPTLADARHRLSNAFLCIGPYKQVLGSLMTWLNSTAQLLSTVAAANSDFTPSIVLMNAFVRSGNVLQVNLTRFLTGGIPKIELANAFSSWNNDLLNGASSLISDIESSVIAKVYAAVDSQQSLLTSIYQNLLLKLTAVQVYFASNDSLAEQTARSLTIWQTPVIGWLSDQV